MVRFIFFSSQKLFIFSPLLYRSSSKIFSRLLSSLVSPIRVSLSCFCFLICCWTAAYWLVSTHYPSSPSLKPILIPISFQAFLSLATHSIVSTFPLYSTHFCSFWPWTSWSSITSLPEKTLSLIFSEIVLMFLRHSSPLHLPCCLLPPLISHRSSSRVFFHLLLVVLPRVFQAFSFWLRTEPFTRRHATNIALKD